jgi:hypothetical protein
VNQSKPKKNNMKKRNPMKINPNLIHKLSALICVICGLTLLPLTLSAEHLVVTNTAASGSGRDYDAITGTAALTVTGSNGSYIGSEIKLTSTINTIDNGAYGAYVDQGRLELTGGSVTTTGVAGMGIVLWNGRGTLNGVQIDTGGEESFGIMAQMNSTLTLTGGSVTSTTGKSMAGIAASDYSIITAEDTQIESWGIGAAAMFSSTVTLANSTITAGHTGVGFIVSSSGTLNNVNITVTEASHDVGDGALYIAGDSDARVNLNGNTVTGNITVESSSSLNLNGKNGTVITGDVVGTGNSSIDITLDGAGTQLIGNIIQDASTIYLSIDNGASFVGSGTVDSLTLKNGVTIGYTGDLITVTDSILIGGVVTFDLSGLSEAITYDLIDWSGASSVDVDGANYNFTGAGVEGTFSVEKNILVFNATAVPEPSTWFLLGTGLGILLLAAHHRRRKAQS